MENKESPRIRYESDGEETTFTYPFPILKEQDLKVWIDSNKQEKGFKIEGIQTIGGEVIFDIPPEQGSIITLLREDTYPKPEED